MINQWLIEDKECLSLYISLIDNLNQFYAADFKLQEKQGLRKIINKFNWNDIIRKNSNNNNSNINNYSFRNFHEGSRESKRNNNTSADKSQNNQNILLKNKIIRLKEELIYLRSLSVEC